MCNFCKYLEKAKKQYENSIKNGYIIGIEIESAPYVSLDLAYDGNKYFLRAVSERDTEGLVLNYCLECGKKIKNL